MPSKASPKAPAGPRPATFDHLKKKQPMERTVDIPMSDDDDDIVTVRMRAIGRKAYDALVRAHPPTDEQVAEHKERFGAAAPYDAEAFSIALIAASSVEPAMTEAEWSELTAGWNSAEYLQLWTTALEVNTQRRVVESGKAYG